MKKLGKKFNVKLIAAIAICAFSVAVSASGVYAWFVSKINQNNKASEIEVKYTGDARIKDQFRVFEYDFENDTPKETDSLKLHGYDCFIEQKNENNKKYVFVDILFPNGIPSNSALEIKLTAPTNNYFTTVSGETRVANYISNLVQFKYIDNKDEAVVPFTNKTAKEIYNACQTAFNNVVEYDTFVTDSTQGTKANIDNLSSIPLPYSSATGLDGYTTQLIIEYTYNQDLIDIYKELSGYKYDVKDFEKGFNITFSGDISSIYFDVGARA